MISQLRASTAAEHVRTEESFAPTLAKLPNSYGAFLQAHASAFSAVGRALSATFTWPAWEERWHALQSDLKTLGLPVPPAIAMPPAASAAEGLGMAYVLEGSRMGSALLLKEIPAGLPTAYLKGGLDRKPWMRLKEMLEEANPDLEAPVIAGAHAAFKAFRDAAEIQAGKAA